MLLIQRAYSGTYDSAFFALACLRAALGDLNRALQAKEMALLDQDDARVVHTETWQLQRLTEILFWVNEFYARRAAARQARKNSVKV